MEVEPRYTHRLEVHHKLFGKRSVLLCVDDEELMQDILNLANWPKTAVVFVTKLPQPQSK